MADQGRADRIVHVVNRLSDHGDGIANVCVDIACQQAIQGSQVTIATTTGGYSSLVQEFGVEVVEVDFRTRSLAGLLRAAISLLRIVRHRDAGIIHAHTVVAAVVARFVALGVNAKVVATVHNEYQRGSILMAAAHRVVGVSRVVTNSMRTRGVPDRKLRTVLNGVVGSVRRQRPKVTSENTNLELPAIIAVGAISFRKGSDTLVAAARQLARSHRVHTYFIGNVDWPEVVQEAQSCPEAALIHFLGFQPDPRIFMESAAVFVLPSRRDPAPLVLIEAMEVGMPIVASAVDGVPELLDHGRVGILIDPGSVDAIVEGVSLILNGKRSSLELAESARKRALDLSVLRVCSDYSEVYRELFLD